MLGRHLCHVQRCHERLANNRQSLLERFRWNIASSSDDVGSARTTAIRDLVVSEWQAFKQDNSQQLRTDAAHVIYFMFTYLFFLEIVT